MNAQLARLLLMPADLLREARIDALRRRAIRLLAAGHKEPARAVLTRMYALIGKRSPQQVARMEGEWME